VRSVAVIALLVACRADAPRPPIAIDRIEPPWAIPTGGTIAHVRGKNFDPKSRVTVLFGDREAPLAAVLSSDKIQVTVPPGRDGEQVTVRVRFADGRSASAAEVFVFRSPPHEHP
jgi:hypothetical protein